jgi:hypothetical protein
MFKSKLRSVVVPQSEHLRLVGQLAFHWGNAQFDAPNIPRLSFVEGVALHDRGYGYLDNLPIGETSDDDWLEVARRGFDMPSGDPFASIITRFHVRRLVASQVTLKRRNLAAEMTAEIDRQMAEAALPEQLFERVDRITDFCDSVSFNFCFERPARGEVLIFPRNDSEEQVPVQYELQGGEICITPWPLSVHELSGYLVGYQSQGYPAHLMPVLLPYHLFGTQSLV